LNPEDSREARGESAGIVAAAQPFCFRIDPK
jgi:hypothetical protein